MQFETVESFGDMKMKPDEKASYEKLSENSEFILSMDIGGTNTRSAFVDRGKNAFFFNTSKSEEVFGDDAVANFVRYVEGLIKTADLSGKHIRAISAGFPSTVDQKYRKIISTPNLKGLNNIEMADILEQKFGIPTLVNRDVCMLLYYDMYVHKLPKDIIVIACYIGTGIGNAIYIGGKLLSGKNGVAGELGHIPILGGESLCGCGNRGCSETVASGRYLSQLHNEQFSDVIIADLFAQYRQHPALQQYIRALAIPIAIEINIFDPHYVILGGGVLQMKDFPKKELKSIILEHTRKPYPECNLEIIYTADAKTNGVIGAGIFGFEYLSEGNS